jgi:hypothetical protein
MFEAVLSVNQYWFPQAAISFEMPVARDPDDYVTGLRMVCSSFEHGARRLRGEVRKVSYGARVARRPLTLSA